MATISNTFQTGITAGTDITAVNSGTGSAGTPFDAVSVAGGNTLKYHAVGAEAVVAASAGQAAYVEWTTALVAATTAATLYGRIGIQFAAAPATELAIMRGMSGTSQRWRVGLTTARQIVIRAANNATLIATSTTVLSTGTHYRVEAGAAGHNSAGTAEVRIYAGDSTTALETMGPYTAQVLGGPVSSIRYIVGASASPASTTTVQVRYVGGSDVTWMGTSAALPSVTHMWAGALTSAAVTVSYGLANVTSARLAVSTASDLSSPVYSSAGAPDADGVVKLTRSSLAANTLHYYGIEADGTLLTTGRGSFTTDPTAGSAASFSVAFGSCQQTNSNSEAFTAIAAKTGPYGRARRMLHEGDLHYRDLGAGTSAADVTAQYKSSLAPANMAAMLAAVPMTYTWDNHDWGGADSNASAPAGTVLAAGYRKFVPHYTLPTAGSTAIYQSFVIGRVRFIQLDTRSQRSNRTDAETSAKTMLGTEQKTWFKAELLQPEPVKIVVSGIYWRFDSTTGDRWGSYYTEWAELRTWVAAQTAIGGVVVISGDRHALYADNGTSTNTYWPNVGGGPLDQGSTGSFETWSHGYYDTGGTNMRAYGWLDITDSGAGITVAYSGITALDGVTRVSMTTEFAAAASLPARWGIHL